MNEARDHLRGSKPVSAVTGIVIVTLCGSSKERPTTNPSAPKAYGEGGTCEWRTVPSTPDSDAAEFDERLLIGVGAGGAGRQAAATTK